MVDDEFATYSALLRLSRCGFALDEFTDKMRFLPGKGLVYRLAMDATRKGDFQKAALLFKAINWNKPFNGSTMNSPPTPPYYGSVAAALHLMNSQCGSCREKVLFIALRWMQPDRGWCGRLKIWSLLGNFQPAQHQRLVRAVCIKRKGFFRFLSFIHSFNFWTIRVPKSFLH